MKIRIIKIGGKYRPQQKFMMFWLNFYNLAENIIEFDTLKMCEKEVDKFKIRNSNTFEVVKDE